MKREPKRADRARAATNGRQIDAGARGWPNGQERSPERLYEPTA